MVDFSGLVFVEGTPIYVQIVAFVKRGLVGGSIVDADEMPSRRVLSVMLSVNPNTIQKAYRMLEDDGLIESRAGAKSYICADAAACERLRKELLGGEFAAMVAAVKAMGVAKEEALALLAQLWEVEDETT